MLNFMEEHIDLANGRLSCANGKATSDSLWKDLVNLLNSMGIPNRDVEGWKKVMFSI